VGTMEISKRSPLRIVKSGRRPSSSLAERRIWRSSPPPAAIKDFPSRLMEYLHLLHQYIQHLADQVLLLQSTAQDAQHPNSGGIHDLCSISPQSLQLNYFQATPISQLTLMKSLSLLLLPPCCIKTIIPHAIWVLNN